MVMLLGKPVSNQIQKKTGKRVKYNPDMHKFYERFR